MNISEEVKRIRGKWSARYDKDPVDWITVKGNHIPIDENGKPVGGQLKALGKGSEGGASIDKTADLGYNKNEEKRGENVENKPKSEPPKREQSEAEKAVVEKIVKQTHLSREAVEDLVQNIKKESIHNADSEYMMLGKGHGGGENSYVKRAEQSGDTYFSMGDKWDDTKRRYRLDDDQMFEVFNAAAIDYAMEHGKKIRFCDEPKDDKTGLGREVRYLKKKYNVIFMREGDYWYAE